jgi:hypothetical protein
MRGSLNPYSTISEVLTEVAHLSTTAEVISALRQCPRSLKDLLRFAYAPDIDLPTHPLPQIEPISPKAFAEDRFAPVDLDLLSHESGKLHKLFCRSGQPLPPEKRISLWCQIVSRISADECKLMEHIRAHSTEVNRLPAQFSAISRGVVEYAGLFTEQRPKTDEENRRVYAAAMAERGWN